MTEQAVDPTTEQLRAYYALNVSQLRWSFATSLAALCVGLCALVIGVGLAISGINGLTSQLAVFGGVITQFIAAGFFYLYSKNLRQLNIFHDKLVKHQDTLYAISLAQSLHKAGDNSGLLAVIGNLLSRGEPPIDSELLKAIALQRKSSSQ